MIISPSLASNVRILFGIPMPIFTKIPCQFPSGSEPMHRDARMSMNLQSSEPQVFSHSIARIWSLRGSNRYLHQGKV